MSVAPVHAHLTLSQNDGHHSFYSAAARDDKRLVENQDSDLTSTGNDRYFKFAA